MVISTHSSHISHEIDFTCLRYFRRTPAVCAGDIPCATVVNLTGTFGDNTDTSKFATRFLKATHCDLFFADAAILVEGPAERMLIPHFILKWPVLDRSYISLLEFGGSHAHRLKPLIETLKLLTLVVTDLDSISESSTKKVLPEKGKNYHTSNSTLKDWLPGKANLDDLLSVDDVEKVTTDNGVRVTYQFAMQLVFANGKMEEAIPYTFEDALVLSNLDFFRSQLNPMGLIKKMVDAIKKPSLSIACKDMFEALKIGKKAEMALELLYTTEPSKLEAPEYIKKGLEWLEDRLRITNKEL